MTGKKRWKFFNLFSIVLFFLYSNISMASNFSSFKWTIKPSKLIQNEQFKITFKFKYSGKLDPKVNFELDGCELIKVNTKKSSPLNVREGDKLITIKNYEFVYIFKTRSYGKIYLNKLNISDGLLEKKLKGISFFVNKKKVKKEDFIFVGAVEKLKYYRGEGFSVNYYLYYKNYILRSRVLKFPKLNGFLKRYKTVEYEQDKMVNYKGSIFKRRLIYSAQLFGEELGENIIDSMKISIEYPEKSKRNELANFYSGRNTTKILKNLPIKIKILMPPLIKNKKKFIGLIGDHKFRLEGQGGKYFLNKPIEFKLFVEGPGNLENFNPPKIYKTDGLEIFSVKSKFFESDNKINSKKEFFYTLIGRRELERKEKNILFTTFDPVKKIYNKSFIKLPGLFIEDVNILEFKRSRIPSSLEKHQKKIILSDHYIAPFFEPELVQSIFGWKVNLILFLILIIIILEFYFHKKSSNRVLLNEDIRLILNDSKKGKLNYSKLFQLIQFLNGKKVKNGANPPRKILLDCNLSRDTKRYFEEMLEILESSAYSHSGGKKQFKYEKKCFKELEENLLNRTS